MSKDEPVFNSTATYYEQASQKWKTGTFTITEKLILFSYDENQTLRIPLNTMSALEKRQSSLFYASVVVSVGPDKHWFASFPNRDSVYNLLELFWREALLSKGHKTATAQPKPGSTDLGKELLQLLHESETTLVNAANSLSDQGTQIEETQTTVADINSDLNVAEKFLKNMNFSHSILQLTNASGSNSTEQQELQKCFRVSYTFSENSLWTRGTLLLSSEKMLLVDENKAKKFSLSYNDVISLKVISLWKFCLTYLVGNVEKSCYFMCPKLAKLLKCLNSTASSDKIVHLDDIQSPSISYSCPSSSGSVSTLSSPLAKKVVNEDSDAEQLQENSDTICDKDIEEISNVLANLQALAAEVSKEQQDQMEKIHSLMSNVEKTDLRMKADTKKIEKLM